MVTLPDGPIHFGGWSDWEWWMNKDWGDYPPQDFWWMEEDYNSDVSGEGQC